MIYVTKQGDTWDNIAFEMYGNEELIAPIIRANSAYVETTIFDYGVELEIPEIEQIDNTASLPPWRKNNVSS